MKPIIAITMGDPSGIGPEIILKALSQKGIYEKCRPLVVGSAAVLRKAAEVLNFGCSIHAVKNSEDALFHHGAIDVLDQNSIDLSALKIGKVSPDSGKAAYLAVEGAIRLAMNGQADATVTAPLNKEALHAAGYQYSGHTEIYADLTNTKHYCMLLIHENLRVVHVSTHVSLRQACDRCKQERELEVIRLAWQACRDMGIEQPRIGVAGLNPHCGENGLFGDEEIKEIRPAIERAIQEGMQVEGPIPPDSIFSKARGGFYDIVVAQYHDQGHIPLKVIGFVYDEAAHKWKSVSGVNITLGLPIIRTSVDHGTAFDQAWKGTASADSLVNAIDYAVLLAKHRTENVNEEA